MDWQITFWEPSLSPHKVGLIKALAQRSDVKRVEMVAHAELPAARTAQGWERPQLEDGLSIALTQEEIRKRIAESSDTTVHIISGMRGTATINAALSAVVGERRRFGLLSEPRVSEGFSGRLRLLQSQITEGRLREAADFVLAIGAHGPTWFARAGYKPESLFPFAYFLPASDSPVSPGSTGSVIVSYLGRLEREKGIDIFLESCPLFGSAVTMRIAGHGSYATQVAKASRLSNGKLLYQGVLAASTVNTFLDGTDILVVPSRSTNDGWAAVVSEALLRGTAVVASEKVGASVLLAAPWRGRVVPSDCATAIVDAVTSLVSSGELRSEKRQKRSAWACQHLTADAGAEALVDILRHVYSSGPKPQPFWA